MKVNRLQLSPSTCQKHGATKNLMIVTVKLDEDSVHPPALCYLQFCNSVTCFMFQTVT